MRSRSANKLNFSLLNPSYCKPLQDERYNLGRFGGAAHVIEENNHILLTLGEIPNRFTPNRIGKGLAKSFRVKLGRLIPMHLAYRHFPVSRKTKLSFDIPPPCKLGNLNSFS